MAINKITLDFSPSVSLSYRVELPGTLNTDNIVLRVTHLTGFPDGTTVITTRRHRANAEKELLIGFDNDPLKCTIPIESLACSTGLRNHPGAFHVQATGNCQD